MNVLYIKQDDNFIILNRLQMFIGNVKQTSSENVFMYLYDQGSSHSKSTLANNQVRILRNVDFGNLKAYKLVKLNKNPDFDAIYNYMPYKHGVVVSIRTKETPVVVSLIFCSLGSGFKTLDCGEKVRYTGITEGYIGIYNEEEYFQINTQTNQVSIAMLEGEFTDQNWNHNIERTFQGAELFDSDHYWVRGFSGNKFTGVINWGQLGNVDSGTTYIAWTEDESWKVVGESACAVEEIFLSSKVVQETGEELVNLTWSRSPYFFASADKLSQGDNSIAVTIADGAGSATNTLNVRLLTNTFEFINVNKPVPTLNINSGQTISYPLKSENIVDGNGLNVSVTVEDDSILSAKAHSS